jgi:hypothetical protein
MFVRGFNILLCLLEGLIYSLCLLEGFI